MTLSDRRMNSLLNKSPESGYIHSRNGASGFQHLCTMKEELFKKKKSITEDTNKKGSNNTNIGEVGRGAEPLSRGCSAPGTGSAAGELICLREPQHLEELTPNPMSKCNPNLSDQGLVRLHNPFPQDPV